MAGYMLTIKNDVESIELSTKEDEGKEGSVILDAVFKMNTLNDGTKNRSDSVRCEMTITGNIANDDKDATKRLAKWSMDADKKTLYRDVTLVVYDSANCTGDALRRYEINQMFVIDYEESFGKIKEESDKGKYTLWLAQKEGNNKKEVFSS